MSLVPEGGKWMFHPRVLHAVAMGIFFGISAASAQPSLPTNYVDELVVSGLSEPISMAFLPDGRVLVTERATHRVRLVVNGVVSTRLTVPNVTGSPGGGERGLQGIAVDPRWPQFPYLYVCYTRTGAHIELTRYTGSGDLNNPASQNLNFASPLVLINDIVDNHDIHNGLCLRFGTDGRLLMSTGDDSDQCQSQTTGSLGGALLRMDVSRLPATAGGPVPRALLIPPDNPLSGPDSNSMLMYAFGLRNPWRFHVDKVGGAILLADVGSILWEEVNEVFPGDNFGWPNREGNEDRGAACGSEGRTFAPPILAVPQPTFTVMSTATVYRPVGPGNSSWPNNYWGNLFYSDFYSGKLRRLVRSGGTWVSPAAVPGQPNSADWATGIYQAVDFLVGPDGSLYWLQMSTGTLRRIRYTGPVVGVAPEAFSTRALSATPNPFRGRVDLSWRLPLSAPVTIDIFDPSGRRVARLRDDAGGLEGRATWDGRDESGTRLSPGLYLARVVGLRNLNPVRLILLE
jgi:glucose/arabinose dehydrogenase